jgi:hypothetical protein
MDISHHTRTNMKRFLTHAFVAAAIMASFLFLTACVNGTDVEGDQDAPDILVRVVDSAGVAFGADTVTWSYYGDGAAHLHKTGHGTDSTHKPLTRVNADGTAWQVNNEGLHGSIFLRARYHKVVDAFCTDHGYVVREIDAGSLPQELTLTLTVSRMCL